MPSGSIRTRFLLLIGCIFVAVLVASAFRAYEGRNDDLLVAQDALQAQADFLAEKQRDAVRHTSQFLSFLVNAYDLATLGSDPACQAKLAGFVGSDAQLANIFIADSNGHVICSPFPDTQDTTISERAYFHQALASDTPVLGEALLGKMSRKWVIPFAQRFNDATGKPIGVLVVSMDLEWVNKEFRKLAANADMRVGLVTGQGLVLARYPEPEKWVGRNIREFPAFGQLLSKGGTGSTQAVSHDGMLRVYVFSIFTKTHAGPVYLWLTLPKSVVTAKADGQFKSAILLSLAFTVTFFVIAIGGSNRLLFRPIETIAQASQKLARGNYLARTGLPHTSDEIGQLARAFDEMAHQLHHLDALTGLKNLFAFDESLTREIEGMQAQPHATARRFAVLRIGLANYHSIEGSVGIDAGHDLLNILAKKLQHAAGHDCIVARLEEDNFALAALSIADFAQAEKFGADLRAAMITEPVMIGGRPLHPDVNIGICFYPHDGQTAKALIQHAGVALDQAKSTKNAHLRFFEKDMNDLLLKRNALNEELRMAVDQRQFVLHYQPQINARSGQIAGFEALIRWQHPERGLLAPGEFIALAEETELIVPIGAWVLEEALRQLKAWMDAGLVDDDITMAVNVSALQLTSGALDERLHGLLRATGLPPHCVELELTESQLLGNISDAQAQLRKFKALGVLLSIDDFGTGYSSLSYLQQYAVDKLKIDKSFVDHVTSSANDAAIVEATIAMGHKLGLTVIAEGVETEEQARYLRDHACDQLQGYHFSRPLPVPTLEKWMNLQPV